ncbi:hypothetical protein GCM10023086_58420 [Streptomyces venetus]|uniref:Secreted protein n=1 Tax=Streptomyces venetus TaxID=1701086 RepID=A0ABP8GSI0_9ACTN
MVVLVLFWAVRRSQATRGAGDLRVAVVGNGHHRLAVQDHAGRQTHGGCGQIHAGAVTSRPARDCSQTLSPFRHSTVRWPSGSRPMALLSPYVRRQQSHRSFKGPDGQADASPAL